MVRMSWRNLLFPHRADCSLHFFFFFFFSHKRINRKRHTFGGTPFAGFLDGTYGMDELVSKRISEWLAFRGVSTLSFICCGRQGLIT